ncbi:MAG: TraC family protein, partial [Cardiobacteriaceae bacterium]|nr:TraC family protein [Cardiobacteriaceae bacterium]
MKLGKNRNEQTDTANEQLETTAQSATANERFRVNPLVSFWMRLTGEWPLSGPPPLTKEQYRNLFTNYPSFADYFSIIDYDDDDQVYLLDDGVNIAQIWRVNTRYMCARSEEAMARFNAEITQAIDALPCDEEYPYIVQIFAQTQERNDIAT